MTEKRKYTKKAEPKPAPAPVPKVSSEKVFHMCPECNTLFEGPYCPKCGWGK